MGRKRVVRGSNNRGVRVGRDDSGSLRRGGSWRASGARSRPALHCSVSRSPAHHGQGAPRPAGRGHIWCCLRSGLWDGAQARAQLCGQRAHQLGASPDECSRCWARRHTGGGLVSSTHGAFRSSLPRMPKALEGGINNRGRAGAVSGLPPPQSIPRTEGKYGGGRRPNPPTAPAVSPFLQCRITC